MADRIIKPDSGNDVVIQNDGGTRKIEVTNAGDVEVTGDLKATTVKATNLKANDGTASLEIADSSGDIGFSGNTNLKIKLPSAGGIYESDGSTEILTESSGAVSLKNTTIDGTVSMASSGLTVRNIQNFMLSSDQELASSTTLTTFFSPTYTPLFSGSKVQGILTLVGAVWNTASGNGLKRLRIEFTGTGITDYTTVDSDNLGGYDHGNSGIEIGIHQSIFGGLITTTTTDLITANVKAQNRVNASTTKWKFLGNGTTAETFFTWIEYK